MVAKKFEMHTLTNHIRSLCLHLITSRCKDHPRWLYIGGAKTRVFITSTITIQVVKYGSVKVSHTVTASSKVTIAYYVNDIPSKPILVFSFLARPIFTSRSKNSKIGLALSKICSLECAVSTVSLGDRTIYNKITNL